MDKVYATIADVVEQEIEPALGRWAGDFDMEAVARDLWAFDGVAGGFVPVEGVDFWDACRAHDVSDR